MFITFGTVFVIHTNITSADESPRESHNELFCMVGWKSRSGDKNWSHLPKTCCNIFTSYL